MYCKLLIFCLSIPVSFSCGNTVPSAKNTFSTMIIANDVAADINPYTKVNEIPLPPGFERIKPNSNSFTNWLRNVELKKNKTVYLYNGNPKANQTAQFAVLNIPVENKDLQQCADAVMRLRAQYLFDNKRYDEIIFRDNEHGVYQFNPPYTQAHFIKYIDKVFAMCGSASLSKQLKPINIKDIEPGDVLIRGGFPGHAVILMDVALNKNGKKIYLLAQSYMSAQDIHILKNPMDNNLSPWYEVTDNNIIQTPEYTFTKDEFKRW
jgi:hypothetical protein